MSQLDNTLLTQIRDIAHNAATKILTVYDSADFGVENKADNSPLTLADKAAHESIVAALHELTPHWPVLSEESVSRPYEERRQWQTYWLVDPLDGTREFIKRNGEFTVNIALIDTHQPILGVVHVPVSGVCYAAAQGMGAFKHTPGAAAQRIRVRPQAADRLAVVGSRSHGNNRTRAFLQCTQEHLNQEIEIVSMGSSLKICLIAEGVADLYPRLGPTSEWDTAAAHCVVEEAGGQLTDLQLQPLRYNTKDALLNPYFLVFGAVHPAWRDCLAAVEEKH
jgi:3'(2'), 5'-bisphosphate nucleotidase